MAKRAEAHPELSGYARAAAKYSQETTPTAAAEAYQQLCGRLTISQVIQAERYDRQNQDTVDIRPNPDYL